MAIWNFEFYIVKKAKSNLISKNNDVFDEIISWEGFNVSKISLTEIEKLFPTYKSWHDEIIQYGKSDGTNIRFYYEGEILSEIFCSIDVRSIDIHQIKVIIEFINSNDSMIFTNNKVYPASVSNFKELIKGSQAFKFCENPRGFIEQLDRTNN